MRIWRDSNGADYLPHLAQSQSIPHQDLLREPQQAHIHLLPEPNKSKTSSAMEQFCAEKDQYGPVLFLEKPEAFVVCPNNYPAFRAIRQMLRIIT